MREKTPSEKIVVEQCRISELSHSQSNCMSSASVENQEVSIDFIKKRKFQIKNTNQNQTCNKCGRLHDPRRCPAYGDECNNCGKLNHWAKKCRSSPKYKKNLLENKNNYNHVHQIQTGNDNHDEGEVFTISTLAGKTECSSKDWSVNAFIDGNLINCKLDTGAQSNVISVNCLQQFKNKPNVLTTKDILKAFGGSVIKLVGQCYLQVELNGIKCKQRFLVTYLDVKTILGLEACRYFKLINKKNICELVFNNNQIKENPESIITEFADVIEGRGSLKPVKKHLKENAVPHIAAVRRIPISLHEPVKKKLDYRTTATNGLKSQAANLKTKPYKEYCVKDTAWFRKNNKTPWTTGKIVKKKSSRRYVIKTIDDKFFTRNSVYIRPNKFPEKSVDKDYSKSFASPEDYYTTASPGAQFLEEEPTCSSAKQCSSNKTSLIDRSIYQAISSKAIIDNSDSIMSIKLLFPDMKTSKAVPDILANSNSQPIPDIPEQPSGSKRVIKPRVKLKDYDLSID
ncbi:uncharacterized protein LOC129905782 [Episyrphus balteatus]|uniref:uncharacterized protein LOC129905782 n=1 Tax=Episyrphus balteatus TaxID=286459 RepID=UPI00248623D1|nr:uncharacterized protein LOC129905782 [Episyrphus balteatus]